MGVGEGGGGGGGRRREANGLIGNSCSVYVQIAEMVLSQ